MVFQSKSEMSNYQILDRGNPLKYLYDSLDNDIMLMRVWAANDVVNAALGIDLVEKEDFNNELKVLVEDSRDNVKSGIDKLDTLREDIKLSAFKIQIVLKKLNDRNPKKTELKA